MKYLSVCSGIEAATQAWHPLGWKPVAFSEIEPFPCAVLKHHYPDVPNWGDMTKFQEWPDATVDVLCGGTPCQSFSVAGLRQGLADPRGNLMLTFGAIAARYRPQWVVWENVPGVLSSNSGRDFGTFLGMLGQLGYGVAYRVLDAQHVRTRRFPHAVPQRRRRVFVVGYIGDWRRAAAVLFDRESLSGHPAPRRQAGQGFARGFECGPQGGGFTELAPTLDTRCKDGPIRNQLGAGVMCADIAPTLDAAFHDKQGLDNQHINGGGYSYVPPIVPQAMSSKWSKGSSGPAGDEIANLVAQTGGVFDVAKTLLAKPNDSLAADMDTYVANSLRGEGFDASEDGTGRGTPLVPCTAWSLTSGMAASAHRMPQEQGALVPVAIQERAICENPNAGPDGAGVKQDGTSYTLEARTVPQAVSYRIAGDGATYEEGLIAAPLTTGTDSSASTIVEPYTIMERGRDGGQSLESRQDGTANAILTPNGGRGGMGVGAIALPWAVRRLTPRECERLMGFPDDFTLIPNWAARATRDDIEQTARWIWTNDNRANGMTWDDALRLARHPDGPRYKSLGNSWAVNCADWIGERIQEVEGWT